MAGSDDSPSTEPEGSAGVAGPLAGCAACIDAGATPSELARTVASLAEAAADTGLVALHEVCVLFGDALGALEASAPPAPEQAALMGPWPGLVRAYLESPSESERCEALVAHLCDPRWTTPLPAEDAALLIPFLRDADPVPAPVPIPEADSPAADPVGDAEAVPPEVRELLDLLTTEARHLVDALPELVETAGDESTAPSERSGALTHFAEQVSRFGDACDTVGLAGLRMCLDRLSENLAVLARGDAPASGPVTDTLKGLLSAVCRYLEQPGGGAAATDLATATLGPCWPVAADDDVAGEIRDALVSPVLSVDDELSEPPRPEHAAPEDLSLSLPADAPAELVESLLQELPGLTADFSTAVQRLSVGGSAEDIDVAQRMAHTLKGSANTVGVAAIANLTHHVEDILLAFARSATLPSPPLSGLLVDVADCLETMGEALTGVGAPPDNALDVLQQVLDWANRIDRDGVPEPLDATEPLPGADTPPRHEVHAAAAEPVAQATPPDVQMVPMVRVPAPVIDTLLRLAGESIILTGQLQERLQRAQQQTRTMGEQFAMLQQLGHDLEQLVDLKDVTAPKLRVVGGDVFDPLELDQYNELHTLSRRLTEVSTDSREMGRELEDALSRLTPLAVDQSRLNRETHDAVLETRMTAVQTVLPRLERSVRQAARLTEKSVDLQVSGAGTLVDSDVLSQLVDPIMHVLRNAVDHGIEGPVDRAAGGKAERGMIEMSVTREGNSVVFRCHDDGAGLDFRAIRAGAVEKGLLPSDQRVSDEELARLVLRPNFSTRSTATQVSGRGIGLDAAFRRMQELGGHLALESTAGEGCTVELRAPVTLMSTHALLVRARRHVFALANRGIEQVLYTGAGEVRDLGGETTYRVGGEVYPATHLDGLLGLPADDRAETRDPRTAVLVNAERGHHVVLVQEVLDSRDMVVKNMGEFVPRMPGIAGATILGDGSVAPVLDLTELLREPVDWAPGPSPGQRTAEADSPDAPFALVVDDSLSARRSLAQFMTDSGYQVRTARDGLEAVEIMKGVQPDVLLVDLEMPRMNGLELTSHVRANPDTAGIPIIMVTSRSTGKHRHRAGAAGVDAYLTKPFSEDELLGQLERLRSGA